MLLLALSPTLRAEVLSLHAEGCGRPTVRPAAMSMTNCSALAVLANGSSSRGLAGQAGCQGLVVSSKAAGRACAGLGAACQEGPVVGGSCQGVARNLQGKKKQDKAALVRDQQGV